MSDDDGKIPADGGIPYNTEDRKPSPATLELLNGKGGGAGGRSDGEMEGGKPANPERGG